MKYKMLSLLISKRKSEPFQQLKSILALFSMHLWLHIFCLKVLFNYDNLTRYFTKDYNLPNNSKA